MIVQKKVSNRSGDYLERIHASLREWFRPDNSELQEAIEKTVQENLFSSQDIKHQILSLKKATAKENIDHWIDQQNINPGQLESSNVLALHAGNLPLVGFQDMIAIALTGARYLGKISRRDPYILPTLIRTFRRHGLFENAVWSTHLSSLKGFRAKAVIFSGSSNSIDTVLEQVNNFSLLDENAAHLMRTAHFSMAYIEDDHPETMRNLTEAVFRYGGKGCRSVGVVVSPLRLERVKCHFTDYIESFWLDNPQHAKPPPALFHRYAYNKAVGHPQMWLDHFLIEETEMLPGDEFVCHWIQGNKDTIRRILQKEPKGLQTIYSSGSEDLLQFEDLNIKAEPLSSAQAPPIDWQPDGIDTIGWLKANL